MNQHSIDRSTTSSKLVLNAECLAPSDNVQLSSSFSGNTTAPEIKFLLNNLLSEEDVADLEARYTPTICEYCSKENLRNAELSCCDQQELDRYVKQIESKQLEDRISTYFLLRPRRINAVSQAEMDEMQRFVLEENYRGGLTMDAPPPSQSSVTSVADESHVAIKLSAGSRRTFRKLKKKMDKIRIFWPQLFDSQMDPINVWGNMTEEAHGSKSTTTTTKKKKKKKVTKENIQNTVEDRNDFSNPKTAPILP